MRNGVIAAVLLSTAPAVAGPGERMEASGFFGVDYYGDKIGLGGSPAPEQRPQTAPTFGGRLSYIPLRLGRPDVYLGIGVEAELSFTPSWTGYGFDGPRPSVFAPVFGYHGNVILRLGGGWLQPHVTAGGGGETVASSSEYMAKETDGILQWGAGASLPFGRWQLRFDGRQGWMPAMQAPGAMGTSWTATYEAHVSIGAVFGYTPPARRIEMPAEQIVVATPTPPEPGKDSDGDGVPDSLDVCPKQPEQVNGISDQDGCPEPDIDQDGIVGSSDKCPDKAEDIDSFDDEDGCPDDDNDKDGVPDAKDACPNEAENKNGIADTDGCVDQVPDKIVKALAAASGTKFETGKQRLTKAGKATLDKTLTALLSIKGIKITITASPEKADDAATELAKKRADVAKWYLIDGGVAEGNITTAVGPVLANKKAPVLVITVTP